MTSRLRPRTKTLIACTAVLATAAFVVVAVQYSDFGKGGTSTVNVTGLAPPPATASPITVRLSNAIVRANLGPSHRIIDMTAVAPFPWDRVYVRQGQRESLLTFTRRGSVARAALLSDAIGRLECLVNQAGYPRGTRFVVRYSKDKTAFLSTARPAGPERQCLVAAGAALGS
jgi:hypothetical protein